tara:strand:- start:3159 stop:3353 length:195 start_codon:yes stop_codon:yes gene_type:complete
MTFKNPKELPIECCMCFKSVLYDRKLQKVNELYDNCIDEKIKDKDFRCFECNIELQKLGEMYKK